MPRDLRPSGQSPLQSGDEPFVQDLSRPPARPARSPSSTTTDYVPPVSPSVDPPPDVGTSVTAVGVRDFAWASRTGSTGGSARISLSRTSLSFAGQVNGPAPAIQTFEVRNIGDGSMPITVTSADPTLAVASAGWLAPTFVVVSVNSTGRVAGTYSTTISVASANADNSPQTLNVTLTMSAVAPPTGPTVSPISKQLWLGYFQVNGRYVPGQPVTGAGYTQAATEGAGTCAVVGAFDFTDAQDWRTSQAQSADVLINLGAKIIPQGTDLEIANLRSRWDHVAAIYWADEAGGGADALERIEHHLRGLRATIDGYQLANRPMLVYFSGATLDASWFYVPDGVDWVGLEGYLDASLVNSANAATALRSMIQARLDRLPTTVRVILIAQAYDRNAAGWSDATLATMQGVYAEFCRTDSRVDGILWFSYARPGATLANPSLRPWHEAIFRAAVRGAPPIAIPSFRALGAITRSDCTQIEGWTFNPGARTLQTLVQFFSGSRRTFAPPNQNENRIAQVLANLAHTDSSLTSASDLAATTRDHGQHWFRFVIPTALKDTVSRTVYAYGVSMSDGQQIPLQSAPFGLTCAPPTGGGGGGGGGGTGGTLPTRAQTERWRGDFLGDFVADEAGFLYPGMGSGTRSAYRADMKSRGYTHIPFAAWGYYGRFSEYQFNYRDDLGVFRSRLTELLRDGLIPCVFLTTDAMPGDANWSRGEHDAWIRSFVPQVKDLVPCWSLGWEINQVSGASSASDQVSLLATAREVIGASGLLYVHFSPGVWSGDMGNPSSWWDDVDAACDGLLYQTDWDSAVETAVNDIRQKVDIITGLGKQIVAFEFSRDRARHAEVVAGIMSDSRLKGYC